MSKEEASKLKFSLNFFGYFFAVGPTLGTMRGWCCVHWAAVKRWIHYGRIHSNGQTIGIYPTQWWVIERAWAWVGGWAEPNIQARLHALKLFFCHWSFVNVSGSCWFCFKAMCYNECTKKNLTKNNYVSKVGV